MPRQVQNSDTAASVPSTKRREATTAGGTKPSGRAHTRSTVAVAAATTTSARRAISQPAEVDARRLEQAHDGRGERRNDQRAGHVEARAGAALTERAGARRPAG
jgi:hypothetical protein